MAHDPNAILAISSTDRYIKQIAGNANQPIQNVLLAQYSNSLPDSNDFSITAPNALINGYIEKIVISQIQLEYYLPTIVPRGNDLMVVAVETSSGSGAFVNYSFVLPYGFFAPYDLAAMLEIQLNNTVYPAGVDNPFNVVYSQGGIAEQATIGFTVRLDDNGKRFYFPYPQPGFLVAGVDSQARILKTYKLFGFNIKSTLPQLSQISANAPVFLYTPYIDIYSDALTNYQKLKDTDSSVIRRKGLIARLYLSGVGNPQVTTEEVRTISVATGQAVSVTSKGVALGSAPFILTFDLNSPKVVNWTPDTAVNSLDFQMRDCYGDLLFTRVGTGLTEEEVFNTEFQMTLLCIEG